MGSGEMVLVRTDVPGALAGRPITALDEPGRARVVALDRLGEITIPGPDATFQEGDVVHVIVRRDALDPLRKRLSGDED
jgi:trk system potassium uptake protein TrkA